MQGPDIAWYLVVAAILFSIGTAGVLLRRSPLIVLLSLEIMLNAGNLALISFARLHGDPEERRYLAYMTLFATGALGVLIRRSPLIVLLSLEIMLNGANAIRARFEIDGASSKIGCARTIR